MQKAYLLTTILDNMSFNSILPVVKLTDEMKEILRRDEDNITEKEMTLLLSIAVEVKGHDAYTTNKSTDGVEYKITRFYHKK